LTVAAAAGLAMCQGPASAKDGNKEADEETEALYRSAFEKGLAGHERIAVLEKVVFERPKSRWQDDALWVIGEAYMQNKQHENALAFKEKLLSDFPNCKLGSYTKQRSVYRKSSLATMERIFSMGGYGRVQPAAPADRFRTYQPRRGITVTKRNVSKYQSPPPVRVCTHEQIAYIYRRRTDYPKAAAHLRQALLFCPQEGAYYELLRKNLRQVEAKLRAKRPKQ